ncbi:MAG: hypothetical protein VKL39_24755, partial [Leptolyngbyaceae bacterium]|nr:hypothetical protein [Leptolyngbyaceae bacterium]
LPRKQGRVMRWTDEGSPEPRFLYVLERMSEDETGRMGWPTIILAAIAAVAIGYAILFGAEMALMMMEGAPNENV